MLEIGYSCGGPDQPSTFVHPVRRQCVQSLSVGLRFACAQWNWRCLVLGVFCWCGLAAVIVDRLTFGCNIIEPGAPTASSTPEPSKPPSWPSTPADAGSTATDFKIRRPNQWVDGHRTRQRLGRAPAPAFDVACRNDERQSGSPASPTVVSWFNCSGTFAIDVNARRAVDAWDEFADHRCAGDFSGDEQAARGLGIGEEE